MVRAEKLPVALRLCKTCFYKSTQSTCEHPARKKVFLPDYVLARRDQKDESNYVQDNQTCKHWKQGGGIRLDSSKPDNY
jgi:hypothetical protein